MTAFNGTTMTYDADGHLTSDATNSYIWGARGHLVAVTGTNLAAYQYDAFGRRVQNTMNGVMTQYLYDGQNPVEELDGASPANVTATMLTGLGIDQYFARTDSNGTMSYLTNRLGSTIALANSSGTLATQYSYEPYGATTVTGSSTNPFQFTGREDDGTGLYYYRARFYSPTFGRFISQDPLGFGAGTPNVYAYVQGDPVNLLDPLGLGTFEIGFTFGFQWGALGGSVTAGIAIDTQGNVAAVGSLEGGVGAGADVFGGISTSVSNAPCVTDLSGPFYNQSAGLGAGLGANGDTYEGQAASNGQKIFGWGLTTGGDLGVGGNVGGSWTGVHPIGTL